MDPHILNIQVNPHRLHAHLCSLSQTLPQRMARTFQLVTTTGLMLWAPSWAHLVLYWIRTPGPASCASLKLLLRWLLLLLKFFLSESGNPTMTCLPLNLPQALLLSVKLHQLQLCPVVPWRVKHMQTLSEAFRGWFLHPFFRASPLSLLVPTHTTWGYMARSQHTASKCKSPILPSVPNEPIDFHRGVWWSMKPAQEPRRCPLVLYS